MKRAHPFTFLKRPAKDGPVYYCKYDHDPGRPVSTAIPVTAADLNRNRGGLPFGYDNPELVAWTYQNMDTSDQTRTIRFRSYTETFFTNPDRCPIMR